MLSNLAKLAAEKARDAAEEFFKLQNIDMAMKSLKATKDFNPHLANIDDYYTAYKVHELAAKKSTWYEILEINDPEVDIGVIKKQYRRMALTLHPDKNSSVAADSAFKIIQSAMDALTDPAKRNAYNSRFRSNKSKAGSSRTRPREAGEDSDFPRGRGHHKAANTSSGHKAAPANNGFKKTDPPRSFRQGYSARVEISKRDGKRKIVISSNGRVEDALHLDARDRSFDFCYSFFFGHRPPIVINCL